MSWNPSEFKNWCDKAGGDIEEHPEDLNCKFGSGGIPPSISYSENGNLNIEASGTYMRFAEK